MAKELIVIGGGAAGFFCAVNAARMDLSLRVTILEKTGRLLSKVRVSGGGRCNVTHASDDIGEMSGCYPRGKNFVRKAFHYFFTHDTIEWFAARGVPLKTEADGRMFPVTDNSETIVGCLLREAEKYGVTIKLNREVKQISSASGRFVLSFSDSQVMMADFVCIACGGYPKLSMFEWLSSLGHTIEPPVPSLFTFNLPNHPIRRLMGVSVPQVRIRIAHTKLSEEGAVLATHWGLSGPAVLRLSAWGARELHAMQYHFEIHVNWCPHLAEQQVRQELRDSRTSHAARKVINHNFTGLPSRLWQFLLEAASIDDEMRFADFPAKKENALVRNLLDYTADVRGKTTYKEEFVTAGGITLSDVDPNTMMSRRMPNLFFAGEVLDVDGITGGYNFQHAWTSGWIAARAITAQELND
ncbi:MAG TPA: NAD(P)/FAD-dependent oxidoreductase [Flavisolibacter sp.]